MNAREQVEFVRITDETKDIEKKLKEALKVSDLLLGEGMYTFDTLKEICHKKNHYFFMLYKEGIFIGIFYCYAVKSETEIPAVRGLKLDKFSKNLGLAKSIAVLPEYVGTGVSDAALQYNTHLLFEKENVEQILVLAWMKDNHIPAGRLLEECGYHKVEVLEQPWADISTLHCHICKTTPCKCKGVLYTKYKSSFDETKKNE
ncbi:MAG: hypothetical protein Q4D60_05885 [Eubacteriales bacterium]|nr:hypothetical protein [Eubacteriales bacterium]